MKQCKQNWFDCTFFTIIEVQLFEFSNGRHDDDDGQWTPFASTIVDNGIKAGRGEDQGNPQKMHIHTTEA